MTKRNCNLKPVVKQGRKPNTQQSFIDRANLKHKGRYNYDRVVYINSHANVEIVCALHSMFLQSPTAHLRGQGCPECARLANPHRTTLKSFIEKAESIHGKGRYNYDNVVYKNTKTKVDITCNRCLTAFQVNPNAHTSSKSGCRVCKYADATVTQAEFVRRSELAHGKGRYNYDKAIYVKGCLKVKIFCNTCKDYFLQGAGDHMSGKTCAQCYFADKRLTQNEFLERCYVKHGSASFDYSKSVYYDSFKPVVIGCNTCGTEFKQTPTSHLASFICCPSCVDDYKGFNRGSFDLHCKVNNNGNGKLYVIKACDNGKVFFKVGITSHDRLAVRFKGWKAMPYVYHVLYEISGDSSYIYNLENQLQRILKGSSYIPSIGFGGHLTECFTTIKPIEQLLKKLSSTEQLQLIA